MPKKIVLDQITQRKEKDKICINFELMIDNKKYVLFYNISLLNCKITYPLAETIDPIVVTFLLHAMKNGYDFSSKYPISQKLFYNLKYQIIPQLKVCNKKLYSIDIDSPIISTNYGGKYVATGISCGIDSLTTVFEYTELCNIIDYKITHLVYFKTGAHDGQLGRFDKDTENKLFTEQLNNSRKFCIENNFPLIIVDSNLNEILSLAFGFSAYERTHTLRNCGTMYLFQKDFNKYLYADTYSLDKFVVNTYEDIAHYEKYLLPMISNENIFFISANSGMSRFDKTKLLTKYKKSYDNLLVCWHEGKNCGKCDKCIRTLVTLDALGKLKYYEKSFDIENYLKHRKKYIAKVIALRKVDMFYNDIFIHMDKKIKRKKSILYFFIYKIYSFYKKLRKLAKKILKYR